MTPFDIDTEPQAQPSQVEQADGGAAVPLIREWHTLTADERRQEWAALVAWVIWIHDLYELAKEERLPLCWPQHPGLVEELRALKAWRHAIYDNPATDTAAHTARSWHGELRQTITAAGTFWAPTCRAGHTDARPLATAHPGLAERWAAVGPPLMHSAPTPPAADRDHLPHEEMLTLLDTGQARRHSRGMDLYAKYGQRWWARTHDGAGWQRCPQTGPLHARLEATSPRLRAADLAYDQTIADQHDGKE